MSPPLPVSPTDVAELWAPVLVSISYTLSLASVHNSASSLKAARENVVAESVSPSSVKPLSMSHEYTF